MENLKEHFEILKKIKDTNPFYYSLCKKYLISRAKEDYIKANYEIHKYKQSIFKKAE